MNTENLIKYSVILLVLYVLYKILNSDNVQPLESFRFQTFSGPKTTDQMIKAGYKPMDNGLIRGVPFFMVLKSNPRYLVVPYRGSPWYMAQLVIYDMGSSTNAINAGKNTTNYQYVCNGAYNLNPVNPIPDNRTDLYETQYVKYNTTILEGSGIFSHGTKIPLGAITIDVPYAPGLTEVVKDFSFSSQFLYASGGQAPEFKYVGGVFYVRHAKDASFNNDIWRPISVPSANNNEGLVASDKVLGRKSEFIIYYLPDSPSADYKV